MKHVTVKQALQAVVDRPVMATDDLLQVKTHELISRALFEVANHPDATVPGSMTRANKARKLIMERLAGKRRPGSHPATKAPVTLTFVDLTQRQVPR